MPASASPANRYTFDPAKGKALLAEAGYTAAEAAVVQGHDLDLGLGPDAAAADERVPAGEPQAGLRRRREFEAVEWQVLLNAARADARRPPLHGAHGAQRQLAVVATSA